MATLELVVSEFVVLAVVCFFLIRYYKGNMVTPDVAIAVYLSWVLGFAGILLLPYDISVALVDDKQMDTLNKVWNFIYWRWENYSASVGYKNLTGNSIPWHLFLVRRAFNTTPFCNFMLVAAIPTDDITIHCSHRSTFFLAWAVLPMQMEYHNSGQFTFSEKVHFVWSIATHGTALLPSSKPSFMNLHFKSGNNFSIVILYLSSYDEISLLFKYRRLSSSLIDQMKDALKKNVWMGVLAAVAGTTYVVYMVVTKKGSLSQVIGAAHLISYLVSWPAQHLSYALCCHWSALLS